tara:strand:- start:178 stop:552 length:375 start_codon:yes stop_codon:yes gene_type:complete
MKLNNNMKIFLILLIANLSISACSDDDPQPGCFQEDNRKIVAIISDANGTIREPASGSSCGYTIEPDEKVESRPLGLFAPCNLTEEFKVDGARVVFSGYVYESFDTEDICADFFEITKIQFSNL